jgi:hypothetical protein
MFVEENLWIIQVFRLFDKLNGGNCEIGGGVSGFGMVFWGVCVGGCRSNWPVF